MHEDVRVRETGTHRPGSANSRLKARIEPFDSFWEAPEDIEKGYQTFGQFYRHNYLKYVPADRKVNILIISCGPGYFVNLLKEEGYTSVLGIDSFPDKVQYAQGRNLNCENAEAFPFLEGTREHYDVIICEQELNHLTKGEMVDFLNLCYERLQNEGTLIVHGLNSSNPIFGSFSLAQNFDHFNTFTEYALKQVLEHCQYKDIKVFPLNLYVFYKNPLNYVGWIAAAMLSFIFRLSFALYGKSNKIFTKKIGGIGKKP